MMTQFINNLWDRNNLDKFESIFGTFAEPNPVFTHYEYGRINLKISKLTFLQEGIETGPTPGSTTAPSQTSYLWGFTPPDHQAAATTYWEKSGTSTFTNVKYPESCKTSSDYNADLFTELVKSSGGSVDFRKLISGYMTADSKGYREARFKDIEVDTEFYTGI